MRCVVKASFTGKMILGTRVNLLVTFDTAKVFMWTLGRNGPMPVTGIVERNTEKALYTTQKLLRTHMMDIGFTYVKPENFSFMDQSHLLLDPRKGNGRSYGWSKNI